MFKLGKAMKHRREYAELCDTSRPLELRTIEKTVLRNFDNICLLLNKPEFKSHRQPNLLTIVPKLAQLVRDIWHKAEESGRDLSCLAYWRIALRTLADKSWELISLVRDQVREIDRGGSQVSQQYGQLSQSLFYIQLELEALFPNNKYAPFKIGSSQEAADWWQRHFGRSDVVTWHDFQFALSKSFAIKSLTEANDLKNDVNITGSDHVSSYEFEVFTRLFGPWGDQTVNLWRTITKDHPAFVRLCFKEVKSLLKGQRPFSYLFRRSTNTPSVWSIGYINELGAVTQILVKPDKTIVEALTDCAERGFLLYPAGKDACHAPSLEVFLPDEQQDQQEQQPAEMPERARAQKNPSRANEVYVVAPQLQCSRCGRRSDEVNSMEACSHILCDACFEKYVQPRLYESLSSQRRRPSLLSLFCPVCSNDEMEQGSRAQKAEAEVDLISLNDDEPEMSVAARDGAAASGGQRVAAHSVAWSSHPLADFDPMLLAATEETARLPQEAPATTTTYGNKDVSGEQTGREQPEQQKQLLYATVIKAPVPAEQTEQPLYATVNKARKPSGQQAAASAKQTAAVNPQPGAFEYEFLVDSSSSSSTQPGPRGGYLFYGNEEDVQKLLRQIPGLKYVSLHQPNTESAVPTTDEAYSQIWDGKSG